MTAYRTSRTFDTLLLVTLGSALLFGALHRTQLSDELYFLSHHPSSKSVIIADAAGLSPIGAALLYRTDPQYVSQVALDAACDVERLGCLNSHNQIFVLDDPDKPNQTVVTAAHEMLHLAYQRLSQSEKNGLAPLLDQAIAQNSGQISDELRSTTTLEDRRDEAHSLLGTEYKNISPKLESHYGLYFADRQKVVASAIVQ